MRRPDGFARFADPDRGDTWLDTITCAHCNSIHHVKKDEPGGFCRMCYRHTCPKAECNTDTCVPFEKKLEAFEARERFRRAV